MLVCYLVSHYAEVFAVLQGFQQFLSQTACNDLDDLVLYSFGSVSLVSFPFYHMLFQDGVGFGHKLQHCQKVTSVC